MARFEAAAAWAIEPAEARPLDTAEPAPGSREAAPWGARPALPREVAARLTSARELARVRRDERRAPLPTGVAALDRPLGGGLPRGELVELVGRRSGGRFSAALAALAAATAAGEAAALLDLGDGLEPAAAAALGADLERLLWLRPRTLREALAAAEATLHGGFHLVVVELGPPPLPGARALRATGPEAAWARLARAARAHGSALLVASPWRLTGSAAAAVLEAAARPAWSRAAGSGIAARGALPLLADLAARVRTARPLRGGAGGVSGEEALLLAAPGSLAGGAGVDRETSVIARPERGKAGSRAIGPHGLGSISERRGPRAVLGQWVGTDAPRAAAEAPAPLTAAG